MALRMLPHGMVELVALVLATATPIFVMVYLIKRVKAVICGDIRLGEVVKSTLIFLVLNVVAVEGVLLLAAVIEYVVSRF